MIGVTSKIPSLRYFTGCLLLLQNAAAVDAGERVLEVVAAPEGADFKGVTLGVVTAVAVEVREAVLEIEVDGAAQEAASETVADAVQGEVLVADEVADVVASGGPSCHTILLILQMLLQDSLPTIQTQFKHDHIFSGITPQGFRFLTSFVTVLILFERSRCIGTD